jgi:hypothetical protein
VSDVERPARKRVGERRWPMACAVLTAAVLQVILPRRAVVPFWWLFPIAEVVLLGALIIADRAASIAVRRRCAG